MTWQRPGRWWRHAITDRADVRRAFPETTLDRIEHTIGAAEAKHAGQIVLAIEPALPFSRVAAKLSPRDRALEVFGLLRVWDTEHNNGVLIYLMLAEHRIEIVADRGLDRQVGASQWREMMECMRSSFRQGEFEAGLNAAIDAVDALLVQHFPLAPGEHNPNELPDKPHLR